MLALTIIQPDTDAGALPDDFLKSIVESTLEYYNTIGFAPPWVSYLATQDGQVVGTCAFKGAPQNGEAEIAYCTLPAFEGHGVAKAMAAALVEMAQAADNCVTLTARTLPEENASTHVLRANGFVLRGTVADPEDGEVYEWVHPACPNT